MKWLPQWFSKKGFTPSSQPVTLSDRNSVATPVAKPALFIGRDAELAHMAQLFDEVCAGHGQAWVISGEAGMGKTALIEQFLRSGVPAQHQAKTVVARGACDEDLSGDVSLVPVIEALQSLMPNKTKQEQTWDMLGEIVLLGIKNTPLIGDVLGAIESGSRLYESFKNYAQNKSPLQLELVSVSPHTLHYDLANTFKNIAGHYTTVLLLDNLQWCDRSTIAFLSFLAKRIATLPILLILPYRESDAYTDNPTLIKFLEDLDRYRIARKIALEPLLNQAVETFLTQRFCPNQFPPSLVAKFVTTTGGVPLFFSEAARLLEEEQTVVFRNGAWVLTQEPNEIHIPATVEAVVKERIRRVEEKMGEDIKDALKHASVQGEMFFSHILYQLTSEIAAWSEIAIEDRLHKLASIHQVIRELSGQAKESSAMVQAQGTSYRFAHTLYHKSLYGELTESQKRKLHNLVGEAMESSFAGMLQDVAPQLIFHFSNGKAFGKVAQYCAMAADREYRKYSYTEANLYGERGLEALQKLEALTDADKQNKAKLLTILGKLAAIEGKLDKAAELLHWAFELANQTHFTLILPEIMYRLGHVQRERGFLDEAELKLQEGIQLCETAGDQLWKIRLLNELGEVYFARSQWQAAEKSLFTASFLAQQEGMVELHGNILLDLAKLREKEGRWQEMSELYAESLAIYQKAQNLIGEAKSVAGIARLYRKQGKWQKSLEKYQEALALFHQCQFAEGAVRAELDLGIIAVKQGNWQQGLTMFTQCHERYEEMGYWLGIAKSLNLMGYALRKLGKYKDARTYHEQAMLLNKQVGNEEGYALCLEKLALIEMKYANWDKARQQLEEVISIWKKLGNQSDCSTTLATLGGLLVKQNQFGPALQYFQESLALKQKNGDTEGEAYVLDNLGWVYFCEGRWDNAISTLNTSLELRKQLGITGPQAITLSTLGHVYRKRGQFDQAMDYYRQSYEINNNVGDREGKAFVLENIGVSYIDHGRFIEALVKLEESLAIRQELGDEIGAASLYDRLGKLHRKQGDYAKAFDYLQKSLNIKEAAGDIWGQAYTVNQLGRLQFAQRQWHKAGELFAQSGKLRESVGDVYGQAKALNNLGEVLLREDQPLEAMELFSRSLALKQTIQDTRGLAFTYCDIAEAYVQLNRNDKAIQNLQHALPQTQTIGDAAWSARIYKQLGDLYGKENKLSEVSEYYLAALTYYRDHDPLVSEEITAKLKAIND